MARPKKGFPEDFGAGDYVLLMITVDKYPRAQYVIDEATGEIIPELKPKQHAHIKITMPILIDPNGENVIPVNLYIRSLFNKGKPPELETVMSHAQSLLSFYRWMALEHDGDVEQGIPPKHAMTIYDVTDVPEDGVLYGYRNYLLNNLHNKSNNGIKTGSYAPSTASSYVGRVINYYVFLHDAHIIRFSKYFMPFVFTTKTITKREKNTRPDNHNILGHLSAGDKRIVVSSTGLMTPFNKYVSTDGHHELSPLHSDAKDIFYNFLNLDESDDIKNLMLYLATEVGLRVEELCTFPASVVRKPANDIERLEIGIPGDGCLTKYKKRRTIEVPRDVMERLYQYKLSKTRKNCEGEHLVNKRLFLQSTGLHYSTNTIQHHVAKIRDIIVAEHPSFYFTTHDLRATFATNWMYDQHMKTGKPFDYLIDDLCLIMGHENSSTTQKYINYANDQRAWEEFSQRKNDFANMVKIGEL